MSNKHFEKALEGLPCRLSSTANIIHLIICYRYDERPIKNGKPNPGIGKSYPGMKNLVRATGKSRQACNTAIESLIENKIIDRVTIGRPGHQAEYRPIYVLGLLGEHVNHSLHVAKNYKSDKVAEDVNINEDSCKANLHKETSNLDTISISSTHKYVKYKNDFKVNFQRWHVISQELPQMLVSQWIHTKESEHCLDLILQGTTLSAFIADLRRHNFALAGDQTAVFMSILRKKAGVLTPNQKQPKDLINLTSALETAATHGINYEKLFNYVE